MRFLNLDENCHFDKQNRGYYVKLQSGRTTRPIKVSSRNGILKLNGSDELVVGTFQVSKKRSQEAIIHDSADGEDLNNRCLVFLAVMAEDKMENLAIDFEDIKCKILAQYHDRDLLHIACLMNPRSHFSVIRTNPKLGTEVYESFTYDALNHKIVTKRTESDRYKDIKKEKVVLSDYAMGKEDFKITPELLNELQKNPDKMEQLKEWHRKYHSFMKDA